MKKTVKEYASMTAASAAMGVPVSALREAKRAGCAAFVHGRVKVKEYQDWCKDRPTSGEAAMDKEAWEVERIKKQCRKFDLDYEQELGELIPRAELKDAMASAFQPIIGVLERHLERTTYNALCRDVKAALAKLAGESDDEAIADGAGEGGAKPEKIP
jgi:hypothetical protein